MKLNNQHGLRKFTNILVFSFTLIPLLLFFYIAWNRIGLPFVFEWGESAGVNQINLILTGMDLYAEPTLEFAPLVYTPIYYYLAAGLSSLIGNSLLAARLISLLCTIGIVIIIARIVQAETKNYLLAWISAMFYLACFSLSDGFFDLARVDSLYVLIVLISFTVVLEAKTRTGYVLFGILVVLGFFIKQSFILVFLPLQTYLLYKRTKESWIGIAGSWIGLVGALFFINYATDNWFFYYIFELPKEHGYSFVSAVNFWVGDTIRPLGIAFGFGLVYFLGSKLDLNRNLQDHSEFSAWDRAENLEKSGNRWWPYVLFSAGAAGAAWVTRSSNGGGTNNCMLVYSALAVLLGLGANLVIRHLNTKENEWAYAFVMLLISVQFIGLIYNPFNYLPQQEEIRANENLSRSIRDAESQVLIPYRSHLSWEMDKGFQIHIANLFELTGYFKGNVLPYGYELVDQIRTNICQQSYELIILDQPIPWFEEQLNEAYLLIENNPETDFLPGSLLAWQQGNKISYEPKNDFDLGKCLNSIKSDHD